MPTPPFGRFHVFGNPSRLTPVDRATDPASPEIVAFGPSTDLPSAAFASALQTLSTARDCDAVLILPDGDPDCLAAAWRTLPPAIAALLRNPAAEGWILAHRASLPESLRTSETPDSLWRWLCEAALQRRLTIIPTESSSSTRDAAIDPQSSLQELSPVKPGDMPAWLRDTMATTLRTLSGGHPQSPEWVALEAGLLLWHDRLDESHSQSQTIEGEGRHQNGDYWHAIMHRREPDYGNSKYWFHRVGRHPAFVPLATAAATLLAASDSAAAASWKGRILRGGEWNPSAFVDLCAECAESRDRTLATTARRIQRAEMLILLAQTCADCGETPDSRRSRD